MSKLTCLLFSIYLFDIDPLIITPNVCPLRSVRMEVAHKADSPDSTTKERPMFSEGEEVLVRMKEGRYFLGTVNQVCF